uniref:Uncharacterized protein n=1 Tax=Piliocolobus tephrosceles TaxID=591936 RepID=A0A8C9LLE9_9PRIM
MENLTKHSIECSSFRDPLQTLPETQLCVSSSYSLWSSMVWQGFSWRAMEEDRPAGCCLYSRACTTHERF